MKQVEPSRTGTAVWSPAEWALIGVDQRHAGHDAPAGCYGQQTLEHALLNALITLNQGSRPSYTGAEGPHLFGITHAALGPNCLHLAFHERALGDAFDAVIPHLIGPPPQQRLGGIPRLRQVAHGLERVELADLSGHGRIIVHRAPGPAAPQPWRHGFHAPWPFGPRPQSGRGDRRDLHQSTDVHPLESARPDFTGDQLRESSAALRAALRDLPELTIGEHAPPAAPLVTMTATRSATASPPRKRNGAPTRQAHLHAQQEIFEAATGNNSPAEAAGCPGQQRLEQALVQALTYYWEVEEVTGDPAEFLGITHALTGPACLHVRFVEGRFPVLFDSLVPTLRDDGQFDGVPGLRRAGSDPTRVELVALDGHGRLVVDLTPAELDGWREWQWEEEEYAISCTRGCPPEPCPEQARAASDRPLEHLLHEHPRWHPAELTALHAPVDMVAAADLSRRLRRGLAHLPAPEAAAHDPRRVFLPLPRLLHPTPADLPHPRVPADEMSAGPRPAQELGTHLFTQDARARTTDELAVVLARQLVQLVNEGVARPGDVLYDTRSLTHAIGGPRTKATAGLVLGRVAIRYGLVRSRPRQEDDPPAPLTATQTMTWEISPAAPTLAVDVADELEVLHRLTPSPSG